MRYYNTAHRESLAISSIYIVDLVSLSNKYEINWSLYFIWSDNGSCHHTSNAWLL